MGLTWPPFPCVPLLGLCLALAPAAGAGTLSLPLRTLLQQRQARVITASGHPGQMDNALFAPRVDGSGRVEVYLHYAAEAGPPTSPALDALGARDVRVSPALGVVQLWIPVAELAELAAVPGVGRVTVPAYARVISPPTANQPSQAPPAASAPSSGLQIDSIAVSAMQADRLQNVGDIGAGVKVGVLSDGVSGLSDSQNAGYLPADVHVDPNYPGSGAEGTAMLEIVHAMAPGAELAFCGPQTTVDFLQCYADLEGWGAKVIVDDLGFPGVDYFASDSTPQSLNAAVAQFAAQHPTVALVSAVGNDAQDWFQAPYTGHAGTSINGTHYNSIMDFGAAVGQGSQTRLPVTLFASAPLLGVAEWNDPVGTDPDRFDLYLVDQNGNVVAAPTPTTSDDGRPTSYFTFTASSTGTDYLELACSSCTSTNDYNPVTVKLTTWADGGARFQAPYDTSGSITPGQKAPTGVLAIAAAGALSVSPLQIGMEAYSGTGPYLYGDYGATNTRPKPDLTGLDGVLVSGAGGFLGGGSSGVTFCGTSAATPNVGALIAALMQAIPGQNASYYSGRLENTAAQGVFGSSFQTCGAPSTAGYDPNVTGAGLAQGYAALTSFYTFPVSTISKPASSPVDTQTNQSVAFTATVQAGTNPGDPSSCQWLAMLDGTTQQLTETGSSVSFRFTKAGTYAVTVRCADSRGIESPSPSAPVTVIVKNAPSSGSGGGGASGPVLLVVLAALAALVRRRR